MSWLEIIAVVVGLTLFEAISSVDNAVVNADVLRTMSYKARRWFLLWGMLFAVFIVRGILPLLIVFATVPELGIWGALTATFSSDPRVHEAIDSSAPILLGGGGLYLVFLFLHWLFVEPKAYAFFWETHIHKRYFFWFYASASLILLGVVWATIGYNPLIALGAVIGSTAFFITSGFKENAEQAEKNLAAGHLSDVSKIMYLEVIDATFSIDGVLGAFAFTLSIPLILLGNGFGALVVRYVTIRGVETVQKYKYLKNGAMYSVGVLGVVMLLESFGAHTQEWVPPLITLVIISVFFWLSKREMEVEGMKGTRM